MKEILLALGAALLIAGAFLLFSIPASRRSAHVTRAATEWFENASMGRYEAAYAQMAPVYRSAVGTEAFREAVSGNIYVRDFRFFQNNSSHFQDDRGQITGQIGSQSGEFEAEVHFVRGARDGGDVWYVVGVVVAGATVIPTTVDR